MTGKRKPPASGLQGAFFVTSRKWKTRKFRVTSAPLLGHRLRRLASLGGYADAHVRVERPQKRAPARGLARHFSRGRARARRKKAPCKQLARGLQKRSRCAAIMTARTVSVSLLLWLPRLLQASGQIATWQAQVLVLALLFERAS